MAFACEANYRCSAAAQLRYS